MNTELTKCSSQTCGGHLEFETAYAGEQVVCPSILETMEITVQNVLSACWLVPAPPPKLRQI